MSAFQLHIVALVLRHRPDIAALKHIGPNITSFLGPSSNLSLCEACKFGSIELFNWLGDSSCVSPAKRTKGWTLCNYLRSEPHYHHYQFREALKVAADGGDVEILKWFFDHFSGLEIPSEVVTVATKKGHFPVLKFLLEHDAGREFKHEPERVELAEDDWTDNVPVMPSGWNGPGNVVRWGGHAIRDATSAGNYTIARWLYENTIHLSDEREMWGIVECAENAGAIDFAEALKPPDCQVVEYMHAYARPDALRWILEAGHAHHYRDNQDAASTAFQVAARSGDLEPAQEFAQPRNSRKRNTEWPLHWEWSISDACTRGDLPMLKWLIKQPLGPKGGKIEVLQYSFELGFTDENAAGMVSAAREGHLNCMKWLLERTRVYGYMHSACDVVKEAARNGHLEILQFIHDQEASLPHWLFAEKNGSKRRLTEKTIHWWANARDAFDEAADNGHLEVVKWIHANHFDGCTTKAMDRAVRNGHLEVVKWLHSNTTVGCTTLAMDSAAASNHLEVVKWLQANRSEGCPIKAIDYAISYGNLRVASWIRSHYPQYVPAYNRLWMYHENVFDTLLFLQVNYPSLFTPEFGRGTRSDMSERDNRSDMLIEPWLEEKYPGQPTEEREYHIWTSL